MYTFRKTWGLRMLKTFKKEHIRCCGCCFGEMKAIDVEKMHQFLTEIDKNTQKVKFLNLYGVFIYFSKNLGLRMLKTFKKEQNKCHGGFFGKIKANGVE